MLHRGVQVVDQNDIWGCLFWFGLAICPVAIFGSLLGWFPGVASLVALIFYLLQIYESASVQTWLHTRRLRQIAILKKKMAILEARELKGLARKAELLDQKKEVLAETAATYTKTNDVANVASDHKD
mgnify:CR=1 FL=1